MKQRFTFWKDHPYPEHLSDDLPKAIRSKYSSLISDQKKAYFKGLLTPASSRQLTEVAVHVVTKISNEHAMPVSGLVVAGFGDDELYPALYEYSVEAVLEGELIYRDGRSAEIEPGVLHAMVMPFAQHEMVALFMEGIDPYYRRQIEDFVTEVLAGYPDAIADYLEEALGEEGAKDLRGRLSQVSSRLIKRYEAHLRELRQEAYVNPIVSVVAMLPKGELASAAEALVNLTSFKRRVSRQAETVGGPIDVAVISKGDGFVWIKRKHYFAPELNHHFFANYFPDARETHGSGQEG